MFAVPKKGDAAAASVHNAQKRLTAVLQRILPDSGLGLMALDIARTAQSNRARFVLLYPWKY
jgi:hypothetical protein